MRTNCFARPLAAIALATSVIAGAAYAENWTRFRGPNGSGHALATASFPAKWVDGDYQWKIHLPGVGHGSPVGWEQRLFVTSGNPETGAVTLQCLDAESGSELWQRAFPGHTYRMHATNSYASTTPAVDAERVYLTMSDGGTMQCRALSHDGQDLWETDLGKFTGNHGFAASPVVIEGMVCLQVDHAQQGEPGALVGINAASGEIVWRTERPAGKASYSTPCEVIAAGDRTAALSQSMTGGMQAVDVHSGEVLWQLDDVLPARTVSSPFLAGEMIIGVCGGGGGGTQLVGVQLDASGKPAEKVRMTKNLPYVPTPVVSDGLMFLWHDQGRLACVDLNSDEPGELLWNQRIGGKFFGSPILADGKIYCMSMEGQAVVVAAEREYRLLGKTDLGEPSSATPAVHQGNMYLRTESSLACLPATSP